MSDLEDRLRAAVGRRSEDFEPSGDLPDRIVARVEHRRRVRRLVVGTVLTAAAAAVVVVALAVTDGGHHHGRVITGTHTTTTPAPGTTTATTATTATTGRDTTTTGGTGTTAATGTTASTVGTPVTPLPTAAPAIGVLTAQSRQGIGPIRAGMTLRAAQAATSTPITPSSGAAGRTCVEATIQGLDGVVLLIEPPRAPDTDILDGVIRAVNGSVLPTAEGAQIGQPRAELIADLGQPTRTIDEPNAVMGPGSQVLVFESGGFAYGALISSDQVLGLASGDPAWVHFTNGCSE